MARARFATVGMLAAMVMIASTTACAAEQRRHTAALTRCPDEEVRDPGRNTPLQTVQQALLAAPPLAQAWASGQRSQVKQLLAQGHNPNICILASSLLTYAAVTGDLAQTQLLLNHGAHPDLPRGSDNSTPLLSALGSARYNTAELLLARGANAQLTTDSGQTALHALTLGVMSSGQPTPRTELHTEAHTEARTEPPADALTDPITSAQVAMAQKLLAAGVPVNAQDGQGRSALMLAAAFNRVDLATHLLQHGANAQAVNKKGETALAVAQRKGYTGMASLLEQHPFISLLSAGDTQGFVQGLQGCRAPDGPALATGLLFAAVSRGNTVATQALLQCGANANQTAPVERAGLTLLWTPLGFAAAQLGSLPLVQLLIEAGADVNAPSRPAPQGLPFSTLHAAISAGQPQIAAYLIDHGADIHAPAPHTGNTPLMDAASTLGPTSQQEAMRRITQQLLNKGARVHDRNRYKMTALHLAAIAENLPAVRLLMAHGAAPDARDDLNKTALDYAAQAKSRAAVAALSTALRTAISGAR